MNSVHFMIDTIDGVINACKLMTLHAKVLAVDIEGTQLNRNGIVSIITISMEISGIVMVYIFDIISLGRNAFNNGLKNLFENQHITKLFYDARSDFDALYHQFNISAVAIFDVQIAFMELDEHKKKKHVMGLAKAIDLFPMVQNDLKNNMLELKNKIHLSFINSNCDIFEQRPLSAELIEYACSDVIWLHAMHRNYCHQLNSRNISQNQIINSSIVRIMYSCNRKVYGTNSNGEKINMSERDWCL